MTNNKHDHLACSRLHRVDQLQKRNKGCTRMSNFDTEEARMRKELAFVTQSLSAATNSNRDGVSHQLEEEPSEGFPIDAPSDESLSSVSDEDSVTAPHLNGTADAVVITNADTSLRESFNNYVHHSIRNRMPFRKHERDAIRLMHRLRKTKASLDTYDDVMDWHHRAKGTLKRHMKLSSVPQFVSRKAMFKKLRKRCNLTEEFYGIKTNLMLPHSKAKVNIIHNDAKAVITSLLTDPRIRDQDYLFFDNNPLEGPPANLDYVSDINTGRAHKKTHRQLITKPNQVLLPVLFYIDAANTGQFADLPITAVKICLGMFNRRARDRDYMWKTLGYTPHVSKHKSRGRRLMMQSGHMDSVMQHQDAPGDEGNTHDKDACKAQDLHAVLDVILESYVKLQNTGFLWDLKCRNELCPNIEFVLFTPFLKLDSDEADKLCGKCTSRGKLVSHLCRCCMCPNEKTDDHLATHPYKLKDDIQQLIDDKDFDELKAISQQHVQNSLHKLRFGLHNERGLHSACPVEMLHALLLGIFKHTRDCFFAQIGDSSKLADDINSCSKHFGMLVRRNSQRDFPKTTFSNGIRRGKLMAKEFPGTLLCMAAVLRCTGSRDRLLSKKSMFDKKMVRDWTLLVETLLEWEMWLKSDIMWKVHLKSAATKHRFIMCLIKKVGDRLTGMGLKIFKHHAMLHMMEDIRNYGVPMCYDTGSNESGHKPTKTAAKLTQRNEDTFDQQTAKRLEELLMIELAMLEIDGDILWNCYETGQESGETAQDTTENGQDAVQNATNHGVSGGSIVVKHVVQTNRCEAVLLNTSNTSAFEPSLERDLIDFLGGLQDLVKEHIGAVPLRTEHHRQGIIFRAHVWHRGGVWRDWARIDWGEEGILPSKLCGFVDLTALPRGSNLQCGSCDLNPGDCATVSCAEHVEDSEREDMSEMFIPITMICGVSNNHVSRLQLYLVDVECMHSPVAIIPDIGGRPNDCFEIRDRTDWKGMFEAWLESQAPLDMEGPLPATETHNYESDAVVSDESDGEDSMASFRDNS